MSKDIDWYEEQKRSQQHEQADLSREEIVDKLSVEAQHVFDPDTAVPVRHRWLDRGLKMSCEGAGHPYHQTWKPRVALM